MSFFDDYPELSEYKEKIEASKREVLRADLATASKNPLHSKIGGHPFWPANKDWPTGRKQQALHFLAQINFEEIPNLAPYPNKGMLQFFIDPSNDLLGMDYSNRKKGEFAVIYHENIPEELAEQAALGPSIENAEEGPVQEARDLKFEKSTEYVPTTDRLFSWKVGARAYKLADQVEGEKRKEQVLKDYNDFAGVAGIKIGGYGCFTQNDIRYSQKYTKYDYLLLQITTEGPIQWKQKGAAHFFITEKDLEERNFEKVLYTWDDNS